MKKGELEKQIIHILAKDKESRNTDIRLMKALWYTFYRPFIHQDLKGRYFVYFDDYDKLPTHDNIKRIRAKIQNEKKLYLPTRWDVAKKRKLAENEWRKHLGYDPL